MSTPNVFDGPEDDSAERRDAIRGRFISISGRGAAGLYLPVQARLDWFRIDWPEGTIEQELVSHDDKQAIFKCKVVKVRNLIMLGMAEGYGQEYAKDFPDYLLKASTVALGRALNALGYGGDDLREGVDEGNIADAPLPAAGSGRGASPRGGRGPTPRQRSFIDTLALERGLDAAALDAHAQARFGLTVDALDPAQCSAFIDLVKGLTRGTPRPAPAPAPAPTNAPTPIDDARSRANRRFHASGTDAGLSDAALHLLAISQFPTHDGVETTTRGQVTAPELQTLSGIIERDCGKHADPETGEIILSVRVDFANTIAAATLPGALDATAQRMLADGVMDPWLVAMGRRRKLDLART